MKIPFFDTYIKDDDNKGTTTDSNKKKTAPNTAKIPKHNEESKHNVTTNQEKNYPTTHPKSDTKKTPEVDTKKTPEVDAKKVPEMDKTKVVKKDNEHKDFYMDGLEIYPESDIDFIKRIPYKRTVNKKLIIFLIENTKQVANEVDNVTKIIKSYISSGPICIVSYGTNVEISEIMDTPSIDISCYSTKNEDDKACLSDALIELKTLVENSYMKTFEGEKEKSFINAIDIIGIGTCKNDCPNVSKEAAIMCFKRVTDYNAVTSKYYCLTDESFVSAAEIGFRSIGAISKKY